MSRRKNPNARKTPVKMTQEDHFLYQCVLEEARDPPAVGRALAFGEDQGILLVTEPPREIRARRQAEKELAAAARKRPDRLARNAAARKKIFPRQAYIDGIASYDPYSGELNCV
jgi:hypothetical protein